MAKKDKELLKKTDLLKRTIPYIKKELGFFILTIIVCLITAGLSAFTPFITKHIIDVLLPSNDYYGIINALVLYGIVIVFFNLIKVVKGPYGFLYIYENPMQLYFDELYSNE